MILFNEKPEGWDDIQADRTGLPPILELSLRDYQLASVDALRQGITGGHHSQMLCAPTGAGKSVMAVHLIKEACKKGSRAAFVVDRISLVDQISSMFDGYGIEHGVIQADHYRFRPWEPVQVISTGTLARRDLSHLKPFQLLVVDEGHIVIKSVLKMIADNPPMKVVALSATPFAKGLADIYSNVVNVTTTNQLLAEGWLSPLKVYAARAANMKGARIVAGEWEPSEIEKRSMVITGDIVEGWMTRTERHFGNKVKTIVFSATVAHGDELCRQFQANGYNFQQVSYKDGNDEKRRDLIEEFRQIDSEIDGLVSCEALGRGFDVPSIQCVICARPYRKSLSSHIQQIGRGMRPYPGKDFCLLLDHSNNWIRFQDDLEEFFEHGMHDLRGADLDGKVRKEPEARPGGNVCRGCGYVLQPADDTCPSCGKDRGRRKNETEAAPGDLVEITGRHHARKPVPSERLAWMNNPVQVQGELLSYALERKGGDMEAAVRFCYAQYKTMYGGKKPLLRFEDQVCPQPYTAALAGKVRRQLLAYWKGLKDKPQPPRPEAPA